MQKNWKKSSSQNNKKITISKSITTNIKFTKIACSLGALAFVLLWLWTLLLTPGELHVQTKDLPMTNFKPPGRKDRAIDHHGGVMIYFKDALHYKRRHEGLGTPQY